MSKKAPETRKAIELSATGEYEVKMRVADGQLVAVTWSSGEHFTFNVTQLICKERQYKYLYSASFRVRPIEQRGMPY